MADRKRPRAVGNDSPAKQTQTPTSNRRSKAAEQEDTVRRGYDAAREPEAQGDGDPGVDQITETQDQG